MPSQDHYRYFALFTFMLLFAAGGTLRAQGPSVQQVPAVSGFAFGADHTANDEIWFGGLTVFPGAAKQPNRFKSFLNGEDFSNQAGFPMVPVGPFPPPGGWPQSQGYQYPFRHILTNRYNLMAPVVSDVLDTQRNYVVQRKRTLLYDRRFFENLITRSTLPVPRGVGVQLTPEGLEKLEDLHLSTLPQRSPDDFNQAFEAVIAGATNESSPDTRLYANGALNPDRVCLPYSSVSHIFPSSLDPVSSAAADATAQYGLYQALKQVRDNTRTLASLNLTTALVNAIVQLGLEATIDDACVKQIPTLTGFGPLGGGGGDFEICFATFEGVVTDADLFWVESVDLSLSTNSGQIDADPIVLGPVEGTARIDLRDAFIRYTKGDENCGNISVFSRPTEEFDNLTFTDATRFNWAQCPNVTFRAEGARNRILTAPATYEQTPVELQMGIDASNAEKVDFSQLALGTEFDLIGEGDITANQGACALSGAFENEAEEVAEAFYPIVEAALGTTWDQLTPTRHAEAMDLLFQPFEVGAYEPANHAITWPVIETGTDEDFAYPPGRNPDGEIDVFGLFALMDAQKAEPRAGSVVAPLVNTYVQQHWGFSSVPGVTAHPPTALWRKSTDGLNQPYDVAMTMSVSALNQILGSQYSTDKLRFEPDASGVSLPQTAQFQGALTRLEVRPNLTPFLYISPEPHPLPNGQLPVDGVPMALHLADVQVSLAIALDPEKPTFVEAARFAVDIHELGVEFRFSPVDGKRTLDFLPAAIPQIDIIPLYSKFPTCPIRVPVGHQGPANDCLVDITNDVKTAVQDELLDRLHSMLADIPAPQFWNPDNNEEVYVQVEPLSNQTIPGGSLYVVFGRLGIVNEGPIQR